ncbi:MAG: hypothetical protein P4M15_04710 [Alphaproteobacteria bacterium]|nr:hypothetical protein [Alphaproteobacteria bacterium]
MRHSTQCHPAEKVMRWNERLAFCQRNAVAAQQNLLLIGFFAGGEIARHHLYGYTGVLSVFVGPA